MASRWPRPASKPIAIARNKLRQKFMLTAANRNAYSGRTAKTNAVGFDSPVIGGRTATCAVFFRPKHGHLWGGRVGSREAHRSYPGLSTRTPPPHPFDRGESGFRPLDRSSTMLTQNARFDDATLRIECAQSITAILSIINNPDGGKPSDSLLSSAAYATSMLLTDALCTLGCRDE